MAEVASAFVSLIPSAKGFGAKTEAQVGPEIKKSGSKVGSFFGGALKVGALGVVGAAGGLLGAALFKGFDRLKSIDQARAKLEGLGNSTKTVDTIMANALASVQGTAFGLGDAATVSAGAVAAGIKPGLQLTKTLKLVADAATIGGTSLGEMGAIFNKVAASNKIQGDVINQLNDKGIPIIQLLGKQLGVSSADVTKLASKGKIDFKTFSAAMQSGLGGAALKSGETFTGALANVGAALSRLGAGILSGLFPIAKQVFGGVTALLDKVTAKVGPLAAAFTAKIPAAVKTVQGLFAAGAGSSGLADAFASLRDTAAKMVAGFKTLAPAVLSVIRAFTPTVLTIAKVAFVALLAAASALATVFSVVLAPALSAILGFLGNNTGSVIAFVGVLVAFKTIVLVVSTVTRLWAAAQLLLDAAMAANPIGLVVLAIAALAAIFVYAFNHSEVFRAGVIATFNAVRRVVVGAVTAVVGFVRAHWRLLIGIMLGPLGIVLGLVIRNFGKIRAVVGAVIGFMVARFRTGAAGLRVLGAAFAAGIGFVTRFATAVKARVTTAIAVIKSIPGKVKSALGSGLGLLAGIGGNIVQGLINGIHGAWHLVAGAATALINKIPGPIRKIMGIGSPSKVMQTIGRQIGDGLALGLSDTSRVDAAMGRLGSRVAVRAPRLGIAATGSNGRGAVGGATVVHLHDRDGTLMAVMSTVADGTFKGAQAHAAGLARMSR